MSPLNILHVFRAPVGGLFRHVIDLARGQAARGHRVGLIADSSTGGANAEKVLAEITPELALGLTRIPMRRHIGLGDLMAAFHAGRRIAAVKADVIHGHGAKGAAYGRLAMAPAGTIRAYTPHGGSLWFDRSTLAGCIYLGLEHALRSRTDLLLCESAFSAETFRRKIGEPSGLVRVVHNGVSEAEFAEAPLAPDATDLLFIGELRDLKGIDVLLDAMAQLQRAGRKLTATLVGDGPDRAALIERAARNGLAERARFPGAMPARKAFALGRALVVPSRAESLPYIVLEAAAAQKPLISTSVGGIPEIYGPMSGTLVPAGNVEALARAIAETIDHPDRAADRAQQLRTRVAASFSIDVMVDGVLSAYAEALRARHATADAPLTVS